MTRALLICLLTLVLAACAGVRKPTIGPPPPPHLESLVTESRLQQGERFFEQGYYKKAMHVLLPLACDGNPKAQYAVGYMYYYGWGVAQDTQVGYIWIQRSASQAYPPAIQALQLIRSGKNSGDKVPNVKRLKLTQ